MISTVSKNGWKRQTHRKVGTQNHGPNCQNIRQMAAGLPTLAVQRFWAIGPEVFFSFLKNGELLMTKTQKYIQLMMTLVLIISLLAPAAVFSTAKVGFAQIDPALVAMADEAPDQMVRVIIREAFQSDNPELQVVRLGGRVVRDLPMLQAFAAVVPAGKLAELGQVPGVTWVTLDAPVISVAVGNIGETSAASEYPVSYFLDTLNVRKIWEMGYDGRGVTVAVVDSGITPDDDFKSYSPTLALSTSAGLERLLNEVVFNTASAAEDASNSGDEYGHGTHVAGIIAGSGLDSKYMYQGVAPGANLISLKIFDAEGKAYESDTVAALQWVLENKDQYNIRVVNLSIESTVEGSYHDSALDAAVEILWFNGVVVVASGGNKTDGKGYDPTMAAPANDPFIITVGAADEKGDSRRKNDSVASFTSFVMTKDGYLKPDIMAPGKDIISVLAGNSSWDEEHPDRVILNGEYFRISGTSMAAPMVSGAVALLLQAEPNLTPDQVKFRLVRFRRVGWGGEIYGCVRRIHQRDHPICERRGYSSYAAGQDGADSVLGQHRRRWGNRLGSRQLECRELECGQLECGQLERCQLECRQLECGQLECGQLECGQLECGQLECGQLECGQLERSQLECRQLERRQLERGRLE